MNFYRISDGAYEDYWAEIIYHKKKFTNKEFATMYNEALGYLGDSETNSELLAKKMCELFGFEYVETEFEIGVSYSPHTPVDIEEINENVDTLFRE